MNDTNYRVAHPPGDLASGSAWSICGTDRLKQQIDHQRIASRAYALYERRNGTGGSADEDWRRAEAEYAIHRANELRLP
jgi:hypothetical protein